MWIRRAPRFSGLVLLALLALTMPAGAGSEPVRQVTLGDDYFFPSSVKVPPGGSVSWNATADRTHTATDETGMELFDSGLVAPGDPSYVFRFTTAASYPVICTLHPEMLGRVGVSLLAGPADGTATGPFTVRWASERLAPGFVADVMVRRPGRAWKPWKTGVVVPSDRFRPTTNGTYRFRSRMRSTGADAKADWSDVVAVRVRA